MRSDKEIKKEFLLQTRESPDEYYATDSLRDRGYHRVECSACTRFFWTTDRQRTTCGDSACQGRISIFEDNPSSATLSFTDVWSTFKEHMSARGYVAITRYPVVARWNPTMDFTIASIAAFQPYVVSGEVEPPAKRLVIPQFCLRFSDVDNVGITGSHCTGFVMIGQHQFLGREQWDQEAAFTDLYTYLTDVLGLPAEELILHEDAWAGGGNFGPCMEFFCRGVELCNQVYMLFEETPDGPRALEQRVLDMGLGQERVAWFTQGAPTIYDAAFPEVIARLRDRTGVAFDAALYKRFAPYATLLNLDEIDDIGAAWAVVADKVGEDVAVLRERIEPMRAIYAIAEHSRALLLAMADGALPGNAGGSYNLRVLFRRAQDFIEQHEWDVSIEEVVAWHAAELEPQYPELLESTAEVQRLLRVELGKYRENRKRAEGIIRRALEAPIDLEVLTELYDSHGISPEHVREVAAAEGVAVVVPDNFYQVVSERHEHAARTQTRREESVNGIEAIAPTDKLYYQAYDFAAARAHVELIQDRFVVLDRTIFYPTSGGQLHDTGTIAGARVVDVFKQGPHVVHVLDAQAPFAVGDTVDLAIDVDRRIQLAQHHTAAHVINGAARTVLGDHVWQAGAAKTPEKGRLDITHYEALSDEEFADIERVANELIQRDVPILKHEMKKAVAEERFGFRLYQGGAVPGDVIRVIDIEGFDTEACGGTHLNTTGELGVIKLLKSTKIQDGIVRIEFVAGDAATRALSVESSLLDDALAVLEIDDPLLLTPRTEELFSKWKKVKKLRKKGKEIDPELLELTASPRGDADPLSSAAAAVSVQPEHLPRTLQRFLDELRG